MKNFRADYLNEIQLSATAASSAAQSVLNRVRSGELQVVDHAFYSIVSAGGQTLVKMFDTAKSKEIGLNNISQGKPASNEMLYLVAVRITAVTLGAAPTPGSMKVADFANISGVAGFQNGVITLKSDKKTIFSQLPLSNFDNAQNQTEDEGQYFLKIPKWIYPDAEIECELDFGASALPANTVVKIELIGVSSQS